MAIYVLHYREPGTVWSYSMWYQAQAIAKALMSIDEVYLTHYRYARPLPGVKTVAVEDFFVFAKLGLLRYVRPPALLWLDSALYSSSVKYNLPRGVGVVASVHSDLDRFSRYGATVIGIVPRCYDEVSLRLSEAVYPKVDKEYDFITIGWYEPTDRKGFKVLYEVAKALPNARFCVVSNYGPLRGLPNVDVYDFGRINDVEKYRLIRMSKYYLMLSKFEGFGVPMLEALACGLPCVASDAPLHNEVFRDAPVFWIPVKEPYSDRHVHGEFRYYPVEVKDAVDVCRMVLEIDDDTYAKYSELARRFAAEYSNIKVAPRLVELFNKL